MVTMDYWIALLRCRQMENCFVKDLYSVIPQIEKVIEYRIYGHLAEITENAQRMPVNLFTAKTSICHNPISYIYSFLDVLKEIPLNTYIKINSVHEPVACKNITYKERHEYVGILVKLYKKNKIIDLILRKSFVSNIINKLYSNHMLLHTYVYKLKNDGCLWTLFI